MKVVLFGQMVASSEAFERLNKELKCGATSVWTYLDNGKRVTIPDESVKLVIRHSDILVLGMSSSVDLTKGEISAAEIAREYGVPYGFYADTYGVCRRGWFEGLRDKASFIFVVNDEEAEAARKIYPNAKVVVSGNPRWEDFFYPRMSREEVRAKLGVNENETMVLCPGGKDVVVNSIHWGGVVAALANIDSDPSHWKVFFSMHPGDLNDPDKYQSLIKCRRLPARLVTKTEMESDDMVSGCDIVIESASGIGVAAACQRKPTISYFSEVALSMIEDNDGIRDWPPCELGLSWKVLDNPERLANAVLDLLYYDGFREMKRRQEEIHPEPQERGVAVRKMIATIAEITS